jgi:hypothetical protein
METAVDPVSGGFPTAENASPPAHVAPPAGERSVDSPAVVAHVEDQQHAEIRHPDPGRGACEMTVTTDASAYDSGDVISGIVTLNCAVPMKAKVSLPPAPTLSSALDPPHPVRVRWKAPSFSFHGFPRDDERVVLRAATSSTDVVDRRRRPTLRTDEPHHDPDSPRTRTLNPSITPCCARAALAPRLCFLISASS